MKRDSLKRLVAIMALLTMVGLAGCARRTVDPIPDPIADPIPDPIPIATSHTDSIALEPDGPGVRGSLTPRAYENYFRLQATEGTAYYLYTSDLKPVSKGYECDTVITLGQDEAIAADDDGGTEELASAIHWRATASGLYWVAVGRYGDDDPSGFGTYLVSVSTKPPPGNGSAGAVKLAVDGTPRGATLKRKDWYSFEAMAGVTYRISTFNLNRGCDTVMYLRDADLIDLDWNDDFSSETPRESMIVHTATYSGTHYLMLVPHDGRRGGYKIRVQVVAGGS